MMKAMPRGTSRRPSMPLRKKRGTKLATMISVELRMGRRTSLEALKMTVRVDCRKPGGKELFSRSRRYTFSTSTMASSTSEPMAMAMPPRLMALMVSPRRWRARTDTNRESGMVMRDMTVARTFMRNRKSTMTTKRPPS